MSSWAGVYCFICCFIVEDESAGGSLCEWRAALSATRDSVLISKQTPKHVLDLRVKSKMLTKSRLENWPRKLPYQSWVQQVGVSINTLVDFIARRQNKTYPRAHRSGRDPLHGVPAVAVLERAWGGPSWKDNHTWVFRGSGVTNPLPPPRHHAPPPPQLLWSIIKHMKTFKSDYSRTLYTYRQWSH